MNLTSNEFDILSHIEESDVPLSQRKLATLLGKSLGIVNKTVLSLNDEGLLKKNELTEKGREALAPYRVKRAVLLAAGFGMRMLPLTLNTPKPLIRVNGTRIIDTILDALQQAEIEEIYIVRGYLGEQFDQLLKKYPQIQFIENPVYNETNNISSAMCAKDLLTRAYVLEADLFIYNPRIIRKYQYQTNYLGIPTEKTDDWCFLTKGGYIETEQLGGESCSHAIGISYWSQEDGDRLREDITQVYHSPGGKERFWEQVPFTYKKQNYKVALRHCLFEDVIEIDTYRELLRVDPTYSSGLDVIFAGGKWNQPDP